MCWWHTPMAKLWATGLTDEQFDAMMNDKDKFQLARMLLLTANEETDRDPNVGQLSGNSPQPFIDELRSLAMQFSGATGVPVSSLGIIQDNPSSAEAIASGREDICLIAQRDIAADKQTLQRVMHAAFAIEEGVTTDELAGTGYDEVQAQFSDPILHTLSERSDWALKVNSVREGFGMTDVGARSMGISEEELEELKAEERKAQAREAAIAIFATNQQQPQQEQADADTEQ